jgi:hypothetical protein
MPSVENPSSKLLGIFDSQGSYIILNPDHSLTAQQVAGNAIAPGFKDLVRTSSVMPVTGMASRAQTRTGVAWLLPAVRSLRVP